MNTLQENRALLLYRSDDSNATKERPNKNKGIESTINETLHQNFNIAKVWSKNKFDQNNDMSINTMLPTNISWGNKDCRPKIYNRQEEEETFNNEPAELNLDGSGDTEHNNSSQREIESPSHHARRPMNAFLIFCKKHRPIVRNKFLTLENRAVTKILGEWWALLESNEKSSYTTLAKEYKDAFFSANPNFKWYKLPAPPLRTLSTRPTNVHCKETSPNQSILSTTNQFTPGKLADESQLGKLSSLLNVSNNFTKIQSNEYNNSNNKNDDDERHESEYMVHQHSCNNNYNIENNNEIEFDGLMQSPINVKKLDLLPEKPLKKFVHDKQPVEMSGITRKLFYTDKSGGCNEIADHLNNMYCDDNKLEDGNLVLSDSKDSECITFDTDKETRKSRRKCKGKRYAEFMMQGNLLKSKRDKSTDNFEDDVTVDSCTTEGDKRHLYLDNTIKLLTERTNVELDKHNNTTVTNIPHNDLDNAKTTFNLDVKIADLPCLSYETYVRRKRDSKKRKFIRKSTKPKCHESNPNSTSTNPVGSKKRKNKNNITHLESNTYDYNVKNDVHDDLSGLATLAEIATQQINQS